MKAYLLALLLFSAAEASSPSVKKILENAEIINEVKGSKSNSKAAVKEAEATLKKIDVMSGNISSNDATVRAAVAEKKKLEKTV